MRILLIEGGWSSERDVSLSGAKGIASALAALGHQVERLDPALEFGDILPRARRVDFAFLSLHGSPGEDGLIQALLEEAGCPYQGAGPKASFLALNKAAAKAVYEAHGLRTPAWRLYTGIQGEDRATPPLPCPLFAKPVSGGSSLGMRRIARAEEFAPALDAILASGQAALVEACVPGMELTCAVLDERALPVILIRPKSGTEYFDYFNKYDPDGAKELCPAPVDAALAAQVQDMSLAAHRALGIAGYSRSDFMVDAAGLAWILETNTLPGMTPTSLLPKAAAAVKMDYTALVGELVRLGLDAHARRNGKAEG